MEVNIKSENADLFDGCGNGSLHLCLVRDLENLRPEYWRREYRKDAIYMDLDFHYSDWKALFIDVLHFPGWDKYFEGDEVKELHERNRRKFEQSISEYPLLARIFDMYEDYKFTPQEIPQLRQECLEVKSKALNPEAIKALRKLIFACDETSKRKWHLLFSSD